MTSPKDPQIGKFYLVPCVQNPHYLYKGMPWIPVLLPSHSDPELGADWMHFHPDFRFMDTRVFNRAFENRGALIAGNVLQAVWCSPVELRRLLCKRPPVLFPSQNPADYGKSLEKPNKFQDMKRRFSACKIDLENPVCPHKGICLAGAPIVDGALVCPGHGLAWDAQTGENIPRHSKGACSQ